MCSLSQSEAEDSDTPLRHSIKETAPMAKVTRELDLARVTSTCTELVLKVMDAGYCLYVHIFMKNIKSLKPFNFYNSNQLMPDLRFQQSRRDN